MLLMLLMLQQQLLMLLLPLLMLLMLPAKRCETLVLRNLLCGLLLPASVVARVTCTSPRGSLLDGHHRPGWLEGGLHRPLGQQGCSPAFLVATVAITSLVRSKGGLTSLLPCPD